MTVSANETRWLAAMGELLRERRLEQGISLETVASATKIGKNQLTAIEEGNAEQLPAMVYVRGFVRVYASYLGVPANQLIDHVEQQAEQLSPVYDESLATRYGKNRRGKLWFAPLMLIVCVIVLAYIYQPETRTLPVPPPPAAATNKQPSPAVTQAVITSAQQVVPTSGQPPVDTQQPDSLSPTGEGAILKLKVNQDCWLNITIDGALSQQYDLKAGDLIEWKAKETIALDLGNAGGVEGIFNGKALDKFGTPGQVVHVVLNADGVIEGLGTEQ